MTKGRDSNFLLYVVVVVFALAMLFSEFRLSGFITKLSDRIANYQNRIGYSNLYGSEIMDPPQEIEGQNGERAMQRISTSSSAQATSLPKGNIGRTSYWEATELEEKKYATFAEVLEHKSMLMRTEIPGVVKQYLTK